MYSNAAPCMFIIRIMRIICGMFLLIFYKLHILIYLAPVPKICPKEWKSRKGSCYRLFLEKVNWFQAQVIEDQFLENIISVLIIFDLFIEFIYILFFSSQMNCRKYESNLVQIEDKLENQWLKKQYPDIKTGKSNLCIRLKLVLNG